MAGLPKKLYYVLIKPGGKPLGYRQKGGGTYTDERYAKGQYEHLKAYGSNVEWYEGTIDWELKESSRENPMEGQPGLW
ncbi:hypothetical protein PP459_gp132 [Streptomyces phage Wakanda]|uniref:Uncharacterized protein n=2 Tax=Wakandavirus TaxID=3044854 RepID=A0A6G8R3B8_9CAUD|nr:hypothetical protein PP459_gp132 [Streptomyces phage Wakanda]YP_010652422.1 hypothetical protein PP460_gp136 [Streptomyces phage Muntaha]QIN94101.1 hypothetical protein SEA_WAKANDA_134 [Streptomyces phage Wakanda]QIN94666.1 hypothetical protein SEA_MUNTAHA_135 [Streptomyces phage Muntaha]